MNVVDELANGPHVVVRDQVRPYLRHPLDRASGLRTRREVDRLAAVRARLVHSADRRQRRREQRGVDGQAPHASRTNTVDRAPDFSPRRVMAI